jgi:plasmid stabilization system protein ParE
MAVAVAIEITSGAERDLVGIWQRRLKQRGPDGDDGADALLDDLVASIESLVNNPQKGPIPPELEALGITDFGVTDHLHTAYNLPDMDASREEYLKHL